MIEKPGFSQKPGFWNKVAAEPAGCWWVRPAGEIGVVALVALRRALFQDMG